MHELGLLDELLKLPHTRGLQTGGAGRRHGDTLRRLHAPAPPLRLHRDDAAMGLPRLPRRQGARAIPTSRCSMQAEVDQPASRRADASSASTPSRPSGPLQVRAALTVGCDGRRSTLRAQAQLAGRRHRRADRRPLDAHLAPSPATRKPMGASTREASSCYRPRRLLAVRLTSFAKERAERMQAGGSAGLPAASSPRRCRSSPIGVDELQTGTTLSC